MKTWTLESPHTWERLSPALFDPRHRRIKRKGINEPEKQNEWLPTGEFAAMDDARELHWDWEIPKDSNFLQRRWDILDSSHHESSQLDFSQKKKLLIY